MKRTIGLLVGILMVASCLWIKPQEELVEPNLDQLLFDAQKTLATAMQGFDVGITTALWTQQVEGLTGTALNRYRYIYTTEETQNLWSDLYAKVMKNLDSIIKISQDKKAYYYEAVADIMMALSLGFTTDLFGDIPYSQAFSAQNPIYDPQEYIYRVIDSLLDVGISIINRGEPGEVALGYGDAIYEWDMNKWKKAAYTLKARYRMHLIKVYNIDYQEVLQYLALGFTSLDDDMKFIFYKYGLLPPVYEYLYKNSGSLSSDYNFTKYLMDNADPRIAALRHDGFWAQQTAYFPYVQYTEALFLKSEAYWRLGDTVNAREALKQAVWASLQKYKVVNNGWFDSYSQKVDTLSFDTLIYEIMVQKYLDLLYHPEAFTDWRRVGIPVLKPVIGDTIPRRFPYPQIELDRNENAPNWGDDLNNLTPVWWDAGN